MGVRLTHVVCVSCALGDEAVRPYSTRHRTTPPPPHPPTHPPTPRSNFADWYTGNALLLNVSEALVPAFAAAITAALPPRAAGPTPADYVGTYTQTANPANTATVALDGTGQLVVTSPVLSGAPSAVMEWAGPRAPDAFLLFGDPTASTCEHVVFGDVTYGVPLVFTRAGGRVVSLAFVNWNGPWQKTA